MNNKRKILLSLYVVAITFFGIFFVPLKKFHPGIPTQWEPTLKPLWTIIWNAEKTGPYAYDINIVLSIYIFILLSIITGILFLLLKDDKKQ